MAQKSGWMWASMGLLCVVIVSSYIAAFYYTENARYQQLYSETLNELRKYESYMFVNILIDYGNGTEEWHNNTLVSVGADLLNATRIVAEVEYDIGQYGAFVTHINGVGGDPGTFWIYNMWNSTGSSWDMGPVASDAYILKEGETFNWVYQSF